MHGQVADVGEAFSTDLNGSPAEAGVFCTRLIVLSIRPSRGSGTPGIAVLLPFDDIHIIKPLAVSWQSIIIKSFLCILHTRKLVRFFCIVSFVSLTFH